MVRESFPDAMEGTPLAGRKVSLDMLRQRLTQLYPGTRFTDVKESPIEGLFQVEMGQQIAYTESSGRYMVFGHVFDMASRIDLTQQALNEAGAGRLDFGALPLQDAIVFGAGSRKLGVFSDPDCPFCRQLESELAALKDTQIYLFPYPIDQLHPNARATARAIWCAKDPAKAWRAYLIGGNRPTGRDNCDNPIERNVALAQELGITATPTLIASDGRVLNGMTPAEQISAWLDAGSTKVGSAKK
jgi:thiol:disulfide interchange protein DsbC